MTYRQDTMAAVREHVRARVGREPTEEEVAQTLAFLDGLAGAVLAGAPNRGTGGRAGTLRARRRQRHGDQG